MIENGTLLQNRYLIEKQIGAGGMGAVYRAVDRRFDSFVAIKETFYKNDELGEAFEREAKLLNGLHHPNLPHVSDYFTENGGHFLVMQFIEGEDLYEILKRDGAFPLEEVLRWTNSLLDALDYLHSQEPPVIHRDIKPQNLKITTRGDIVLLDFGLAKLNSDDTQAPLSVFGYSRKYAPLEQIQGTGTDARSDIFALGATVYQLLTGKPPVDALARAAAIVAGKPDSIELASEINEKIPVAIASVLNSALALNADARFVSAQAMKHALENAHASSAPEKIEEPKITAPVITSEIKVVNAANNEDFPALQSFAAEAANNTSQPEKLTSKAHEISIPNAQTPKSLPPVSHKIPLVANEVSRFSAPSNASRFGLAAWLILLSCVGLAVGYFVTKPKAASESNQISPTQPVSGKNSNVEQTATLTETPIIGTSDISLTEKAAQTKPTSAKSDQVIEKREPTAEPTEKTKAAPEKSPAPRPVAKKTAPRAAPPQQDDTRERVIETPVPDIESIFTGRPSNAQREQIIRRQQQKNRNPDEMSEAEYQEYLRQRREMRRQRNRIPPY